MPRKKLTQQMLFLLPTLSLSVGVMADEDAVKLDELTITSTRSDTLLKESPQVVTVISQDQIQQQMEFSSEINQILAVSNATTKSNENSKKNHKKVPRKNKNTFQPKKIHLGPLRVHICSEKLVC